LKPLDFWAGSSLFQKSANIIRIIAKGN